MALRIHKTAMIGRFKPLHLGAARVLEALCENSEYVLIGIGSSNKYNLRNPFTPSEVKGMINSFLSPRFKNYSFIEVPDFAHLPEFKDGKKWREYVIQNFGTLDLFVTSNPFVESLLKNVYNIVQPSSLLQKDRQIKLRATEVRVKMAQGSNWHSLVPEQVVNYLENRGLVDRFRQEFGLATIASLFSGADYNLSEDVHEEKAHAGEM